MLFDSNRSDEATQCLRALVEEPHASVLHAMIKSMHMPGAIDLLDADTIAALEEPVFIGILMHT
jgi:hypothetical protein